MNLAKESYDEPNAMTIATVNEEGFPSARMVLLKEVKHNQGFVFFTNYGSRKAAEIENNPNVALVFYWDKLKRSVRVEGKAERISAHESQDYFFSRSKASQIGSAVSPQSQLVQRYCFRTFSDRILYIYIRFSRDWLWNRNDDLEKKETIEMPNWGGYLVNPIRIGTALYLFIMNENVIIVCNIF